MIHIIGRNKFPQMAVFDDVAKALAFDTDIYLGAFAAKLLGVELENKVIYNMEYLYDANPMFNFGYLETLCDNIVIDFSKSNIEYLKKIGVEAFYMPYGFHRALVKDMSDCEKDIDVLFIGTMHHARRQKVLAELAKHCKVVIADNAYGVELDCYLKRAKVHLNMHHAEGQPLESVRLNYLMANDCNIVSERGSCEELNAVYEPGLTFCKYDYLVECCLHALKHPVSSFETISKFKHDCSNANNWIKRGLV